MRSAAWTPRARVPRALALALVAVPVPAAWAWHPSARAPAPGARCAAPPAARMDGAAAPAAEGAPTAALVGTWEMLSGPFVGATLTLDGSGGVKYAPPSEIWRGGKWAPLGAKSVAAASSDGGALVRAVRASMLSKKSGDELVFEGDVGPGGEPGSLAISGRVKRNAAARKVKRWDFAKAIAWGEVRGTEDKGTFVLLKRGALPA